MRNLEINGDWSGLVDTICRIAELFGETSFYKNPQSLDCGHMSPTLIGWSKEGKLFDDPYTFDVFIQLYDDGIYLVQLDPEIASLDGGYSLIGWLVSRNIGFTIGDQLVSYADPSMGSFDAEGDKDEQVEVVL